MNSKSTTNFIPWIVALSASSFFFYEFIQGNIFAAIADNIMTEFHIAADKMTYLSSVYYLANVIFIFFSGILLDRFSPKKVIIVAMFFCVISTFILAYTQNFYWALCCRFIAGIGSAFCFLGPLRIATHWFKPKKMALVTGVIITIAMLGGMVAQYPLTKLVTTLGWRSALIVVGWLGFALLFLIIFGVREKKSKLPPIMHISSMKVLQQTYLNLQNIKTALYTSLMNIPIAVFGAMIGSLYIMQKLSVSKEDAAIVNMMLFLGAIIGGPLIGWISDKLTLRVLPMKIGACLSLFTVFIILFIPVSFNIMQILFFLLGLFTSAQTLSYVLVAQKSNPLFTASSVSIISLFTQGGYIIYQNLFSILLVSYEPAHIIDGTPIYSLGAYQYATLIIPLAFVFALLCVQGIKEAD